MKTLKQVCENCHVTRRALQGYEKRGLVSFSGKNKMGHNLYSEEDIKRIHTIRKLQNFGFTIKEIQMYIDADWDILKEVLTIKKDVLFLEIEEKKRILEELMKLLDK